MPDAAEVVALLGELRDRDDVGVALESGHEGVAAERSDAAGEGEELVAVEDLVAEEHHLVLEPGLADGSRGLVVEVGELHAVDLGAERARDRSDVELHWSPPRRCFVKVLDQARRSAGTVYPVSSLIAAQWSATSSIVAPSVSTYPSVMARKRRANRPPPAA